MILSGALTLVDARFRAILKREKEKIEYKIEDKFTVFDPLYYKLQLSFPYTHISYFQALYR